MKLYSFLFISLFTLSIAKAQINSQIINHSGFNYFSIKDTSNVSTIDSVRFIVSSSLSQKKPLLLFIQGSGQNPLFYSDNEEYFCSVSSLFPGEFMEKYHIVIISKPGLPMLFDFNSRNQILNDEQIKAKFLLNDNLDYYVNTSAQVIKYLLSTDFIDHDKIYIIGHSQGYSVAAKLACNYSQLITKVVCMSSNPFDRQSTSIYTLKKKELLNEINPIQMQEYLDSIYNHQRVIAEWYRNRNSYQKDNNYSYYLNDYSFNFDPPINYLLKVDKPILIVYGTNDDASALNDFLPIFFYRHNKLNLTMLRLPNLDHNYFSKTSDESGRITKNAFNWPIVLTDVGKWLDKN